jgi:hypothetical protein
MVGYMNDLWHIVLSDYAIMASVAGILFTLFATGLGLGYWFEKRLSDSKIERLKAEFFNAATNAAIERSDRLTVMLSSTTAELSDRQQQLKHLITAPERRTVRCVVKDENHRINTELARHQGVYIMTRSPPITLEIRCDKVVFCECPNLDFITKHCCITESVCAMLEAERTLFLSHSQTKIK